MSNKNKQRRVVDMIAEEMTQTGAAPAAEELNTQGAQEENLQQNEGAQEQVQEQQQEEQVTQPVEVASIVQPIPPVAPAPIVQPVVTPAPVITPAQKAAPTSDADFQQLTENMLLKGTSEQKYIITTLRSYIEAMKPGKRISSEEGAKHQYTLWRLLFNVIHNHPRDQFKSLWQLVLAYFNEYGNGVLGDDYIYRFSEAWKYNANELKAFQRLLDLIRLTAESSTSANGLKQYDFNRGLSVGFTEDGVSRLVNFYKR